MNVSQLESLDFPPELCSKPLALICLSGLDNTNNLHSTIWDSFRKNYNKSSVLFKLVQLNHQFPPVKPKRTSYDRYIPKGILKRGWVKKHTEEVPAVVVVLYDLDWDDPNWELKKNDCASRVLSLKASLEGRFTRFAVILVQRKVSLPAGDDVAAADRAAAVCAACELNSKWLFVLSQGDHLQGCIIRVENALHELAQTYYAHEIKQLKLHKDHLNQTTHQYLFVRHQFKMGYLCEQKQEIDTAQKHYLQAYIYIKEVRMVETNMYEVKLIAGFINYKLCQLLFKLNHAKDAISQFRNHIEFYKNKVGQKELLFEHNAWMSKQYFMFAEIFDDTIRMGLTAVQTQHPGYYYKLAAEQSINRKTNCVSLCKSVTEYPELDPLHGLDMLEFFGQRPWRAGKLSAEPIDSAKERDGIQALQFREKQVNHSSIIISQLGNSISQFKTFKCPRMRLHLVVIMADECYCSGDYGKALTLLTHMLWDCRNGSWWSLMSVLLSKALSCAYLACNVQDYLSLSLEALGPSVVLTSHHKKSIFNNIMSLLKKQAPQPEPNVTQEQTNLVQAQWINNTSQPLNATIEMNNITSCMDVKVKFQSDRFLQGESIGFNIYIRYNFELPIVFSKLSVLVSTSKQTTEVSIPAEAGTLLFEEGNVKKYTGTYMCDNVEAGTQVHINNVLLTMCQVEDRLIVLKYPTVNTCEGVSNVHDVPNFGLDHLRGLAADSLEFERLEPACTADITVKECNVEFVVRHQAPALQGEWFPITVTINNNETNVKQIESSLEVSLQGSKDDSTLDQTTQLCADLTTNIIQPVLNIKIDDVEAGGELTVQFHIRGHRTGDRNILVKLNYTAVTDDDNDRLSCCKQDVIQVAVVKPFEVTTQLLSMKCEPIDHCYSGESFLLTLAVQMLSPWSLHFHHSTMDLGLYVKPVDKELRSLLAGTILNKNETGSDTFVLIINEPADQPIALGTYLLKWSRFDSSEVTSSSVTVKAVKCEPVLFGVNMNLPANGWVERPMSVVYNLFTNGNNLVQLDLMMEASDAFVFVGRKQLHLRLLPGSVRKLEYIFYPLYSGLVSLPKLVSTVTNDDKHQIVLDRNLPTHVYIIPQEKNQSAAGL